jgi:hypothetical protein
MVLNYNQVHEASLVHMNDAVSLNGPVCKDITNKWLAGMGKFVRTEGYPQTSVSLSRWSDHKQRHRSHCRGADLVVCQPTLSIPLFGTSVPGLNAPMAFSISSESTMENPDNAPMVMSGQSNSNQNAKVVTSGGGSSPNSLVAPLDRGGWDRNDLRLAVPRALVLGSSDL